ncbi:MAG: hypothetical protein ABJB40_12015, partial [Acidobacteriota bacterium]
CSTVSTVVGQKLPKGATVLEEHNLPRHRKLVLWIPDAVKVPNETDIDFYTCPTQSRGSFYSGDVRVTLINTKTGRVLNTLHVKGNGDSMDARPTPLDPIDLPYAIQSGYYYYVPNGSPKLERKPQIIDLKDYNGDGKALEFALFDAPACMGLSTTLIGYSESKDRVIQYPITVHAPEGTTSEYWLDYLFSKKPIRPGYWRYEIDYRGRDGTLDKFTVRYDKSRETFTASVTRKR